MIKAEDRVCWEDDGRSCTGVAIANEGMSPHDNEEWCCSRTRSNVLVRHDSDGLIRRMYADELTKA